LASNNDRRQCHEKKLGADSRPYKFLGACNPPFAHKALQAEDKIGTMLPCNVIVQETAKGQVEVAAVDPVADESNRKPKTGGHREQDSRS
jgi:uncharacterized protein (DUF302 family)